MKFLITLSTFIILSTALHAQELELDSMVIDTVALRAKLKAAPLITQKQLCANRWRMEKAWIQWFNQFGTDGPVYQEMEEFGYVYTFHEDGVYDIDAILNTDGIWYFDKENKMVILRSNFRKTLDRDAYMILEGDTLIVYEWDGDLVMATYMVATEEGYDD